MKILKKMRTLFTLNKKLTFGSFAEEVSFYENIYTRDGLGKVLNTFFKVNNNRSNFQKANILLRLAKNIYEKNNDKDLRFLLASIALGLDCSKNILKGYIWASLHTGYLDNAAKGLKVFLNMPEVGVDEAKALKAGLASRLKVSDIDKYLSKVVSNTTLLKKVDSLSASVTSSQKYYESYLQSEDKLVDELFDLYLLEGNLKSIQSILLVDFRTDHSFSKKNIQKILIKLGKKIGESDHKADHVELLDIVLGLGKDVFSVRAAYWGYNKAGNIDKSKECITWLDNIPEAQKTAQLNKFISERKESYVFLSAKDIEKLIVKARALGKDSQYVPSKKKIAYILHNSLPFASGGYATRGHGLALAMQEKGYSVVIINRPGFPLDINSDLKPRDITLEESIDNIRYARILAPTRKGLSTYQYIIKASDALIEKFKVEKPSIVMAASNHLTALPALIAAKTLNIPFYYEVRGFWEITRISREPEFENTEMFQRLCEFESLAAKESEHVFTLTTPMMEELIRRGVDKNKITLLPNSCSVEDFIPRERDQQLAKKLNIAETVPVIGYIGTFVQYEGLDHLAEACGLLKQKGIEFRLLIVGNENTAGTDRGPITEKILEIAKNYAFEDWLIMPGRIPYEEVESYYSLIDIAPFPRKPQPVTEMVSPMKPLEAAAMKKAILVSSVRALTDMIIENKTGLVFEKGNINDFSFKLGKLITDPALRLKLGDNARNWVEFNRTWKITADSLIDVLE